MHLTILSMFFFPIETEFFLTFTCSNPKPQNPEDISPESAYLYMPLSHTIRASEQASKKPFFMLYTNFFLVTKSSLFQA